MKSRPILFSTAMVKALLDGSKTQTRRTAKLSNSQCNGRGFECLRKPSTGEFLPLVNGQWQWKPAAGDDYRPYPNIAEYCPYGQPGDQLWVRETTCIAPKHFATPDDTCIKDAEGDLRYVSYKADGHSEDAMRDYKLKWTPSILVPRWASRITLEIQSAHVERLNDITEEDAMAEGCGFLLARHEYLDGNPDRSRQCYRILWEQINGPGSWNLNPYVWALEFKRIHP